MYKCRQKTYRHKYGFAEICFECDTWILSPFEWERHCQGHLDSPTDLLRCDPLLHQNTPVKSGWCPFCLGRHRLRPSQKMKGYLDRSIWYKHIKDHLKGLKSFNCDHPACCKTFENTEELQYHLTDVHCWYTNRESPKRTREEFESDLLS